LATTKNRVISGMRPTGKLHIGHYFGALQNWVRLQNEVVPSAEDPNSPLATRHPPLPAYECFYFVADWHALTSDYADTSAVAQNTIEIVTDYLAAGLNPQKSVIFQQSLVPEHAELHLLLGMVTPLSWLERVPTYKEQIENVKEKDLHTYGFLGYPCLQTADIVMYSEPGTPLFVPVGEDQVSHVELSREIVRRFDVIYRPIFNEIRVLEMVRRQGGFPLRIKFKPERAAAFDWAKASPIERRTFLESGLREQILQDGRANYLARIPDQYKSLFDTQEVLTEPSVMLTKTPRIPGLDGRKMSKSYGNAITLSESDDDIRKKTKVMVTDPARRRRTDPGNPDVCPVYDWHKLFSPPETLKWSAEGCRTAAIGCIECKAKMADHLIEWITPIRERRVDYEKNPARVLEVIDEGSKKARAVAKITMERVREAVFGWQKKRAEIKAVSVKVHDTHG
jgi:tryptophanyl-tRNA synthetase